MCNFHKRHYEEQIIMGKIILNLGKWLRCHLNFFICSSGGGKGCKVILKFGPVVQEEMLFKEKFTEVG